MGPDLQIKWTEVCANPADFEKLVKLLLQRLYPRGEVIDGRGGDGGREFQVHTDGRLEVYEAKSFTDRVRRRNPNRRRQVEDSLKSAARLQPDAWHLVVPIDHSPDEKDWFDGLRAGDYPFVDQWHGQTWLEERLALHPDLLRYATQNRLLEYVRQYKLETEALSDGATTLLERYRALDRLANEVNLYWRPVVGRLPDGTPYASVQPKRDDAAEQAPITFRLGVKIPEGSEHDALREAWRTNLELGTSAKIPGEFVTEFSATGPPGLGLPTGDRVPDLIEIVAVPETDISKLPTQTLEVYEPAGRQPIASLTFHPEHRTSGARGVRVTAYDEARTVELVTDVRERTIILNLHAQEVGRITPAALQPSLRFARAIVPSNRLVLTVGHGERRYREQTLIEEAFLATPLDENLLEFVDDLAEIQRSAGTTFPLPDVFTREDALNARRMRRLLDGEPVEWLRGPLTVSIVPDRIEEFRAQFAEQPQGWLRVSYDDIEIDFGGYTVHTGPIWLLGEMSVDLDTIATDADTGAPTAQFEVLGDGWMYARRGVPEEQGSGGIRYPSGSGRVEVSAHGAGTPRADDADENGPAA